MTKLESETSPETSLSGGYQGTHIMVTQAQIGVSERWGATYIVVGRWNIRTSTNLVATRHGHPERAMDFIGGCKFQA